MSNALFKDLDDITEQLVLCSEKRKLKMKK